MKFKHLLDLPYDQNTGKIEHDALLREFPQVPISVITQFLSDHARKDSYQEHYSWLDLSKVRWNGEQHCASDLAICRYNPSFLTYVGTCTTKAMNISSVGWEAIDSRESVQSSWRKNRTWEVSPVFLRQDKGPRANLQLVEGHSRIGCLIGLLNVGEIEPDSLHLIWCGTYS